MSTAMRFPTVFCLAMTGTAYAAEYECQVIDYRLADPHAQVIAELPLEANSLSAAVFLARERMEARFKHSRTLSFHCRVPAQAPQPMPQPLSSAAQAAL
ncbi:hypothetical protein [Pseudomonas sp. nanlin1]|uniref:hypothetical protein n=1 Tax=Pseudomonas sp. nanlin1 TaxID=3040605 RepID=UPI00388CF340